MEKVQIIKLKKILLLACLGLIFSIPINAQNEVVSRSERKAIAEQSIKDLNNGTLILRLKSKRNKIKKLKELLSAPDIKEGVRVKLSKELGRTIDERNRYNITLVDAFENHYSFSNIYYMYDTASVSLKNGTRKGIFLDKNLEFDPNIEIPEGNFFVVKTGTTNATSTTGVEAIVIMNKELKDMQRPFPYYVRLNSIGRLFTRIFNHKNLVKKDSKDVVTRLERNLQKYGAAVIR